MCQLPSLRVALSHKGTENRQNNCTFRENANWQNDTIKEVYKQANSGGVLFPMGNPKPMPVYWDKLLINASQVTKPAN